MSWQVPGNGGFYDDIVICREHWEITAQHFTKSPLYEDYVKAYGDDGPKFLYKCEILHSPQGSLAFDHLGPILLYLGPYRKWQFTLGLTEDELLSFDGNTVPALEGDKIQVFDDTSQCPWDFGSWGWENAEIGIY